MKTTHKLLALLLAMLLSGCSLPVGLPKDSNTAPAEAETTVPTTQPEILKDAYCLTAVRVEYGTERIFESTVSFDEAGVHLIAVDKADCEDLHYSWSGLLLQSETYDAEGQLYYTMYYTYDEAGRELSWDQVWPDGRTTGLRYTYNEAGQILATQDVRQDDLPGARTEYVYDEQGRLSKSLSYDYKGDFCSTCYYTYDEQGYLIRTDTDNEEGYGISEGYFLYTYDGNGRLIEKHWNTDSTYSTRGDHYYAYDELGRLVNYQRWSFGSIDSDVTYTYSPEGYLTNISDPAENYTYTFVYEQLQLPAALADAAAVWSLDAVLKNKVDGPSK